MSQIVNPQVLLDYSARTWVTDEIVFASTFGKEFRAVQRRVNQLNDAIYDTNNRHAASVQPTSKVAGQIWFDSSNKFWMGDPDAAGADDNIATRLTAYQHSYVTAGTDTFKARGVIESNTTAVTRTDAGVLMTYTLPANTLDSNGKALRITIYGTKIGDGNAGTKFRFGTTPSALFHPWAGTVIAITATAWFTKIVIVRITATSIMATCSGFSTENADSGTSFKLLSSDVDLTASQIIDFNITTLAATSITQKGMLIELLN